MAQPAANGVVGGRKSLGITAFWPNKCAEPPMLCEHWINRFSWVVIAKHAFNPTSFYFAKGSTNAQITALPPELLEKNWVKVEKNLFPTCVCALENGVRTRFTTGTKGAISMQKATNLQIGEYIRRQEVPYKKRPSPLVLSEGDSDSLFIGVQGDHSEGTQ